MFEGLFEFIETTIFSLVSQIVAAEPNGVEQARKIAMMLLTFAERNKGMTRVLSGDALVTEDERLQGRVSQITDRIDASFRQSLRQAVTAGTLHPATEITALAALLTQMVLGSWLRFAQSRWQSCPSTHMEAQLKFILDAGRKPDTPGLA
jgi:TetR/AcrR family transcriptional regulator